MKNLFFAVLSLLAATASAQVSHSFTSQVADYQITPEQAYKVVSNQQTNSFTTQVGAPQLPIFTKNFVLPAGSTVTNINISNQNQVLLDGNAQIYPSQPEPDWVSAPAFVPPNAAIYNSSNPISSCSGFEIFLPLHCFGFALEKFNMNDLPRTEFDGIAFGRKMVMGMNAIN